MLVSGKYKCFITMGGKLNYKDAKPFPKNPHIQDVYYIRRAHGFLNLSTKYLYIIQFCYRVGDSFFVNGKTICFDNTGITGLLFLYFDLIVVMTIRTLWK